MLYQSWKKWSVLSDHHKILPPINVFAPFPYRGRFDVVGLDDEFIYAVGGSNGHSEESSVEVYDPKTEKWTYGPTLPVSLSNIGKKQWARVRKKCNSGKNLLFKRQKINIF